MSNEDRLKLEQELLLTCSKAQAINKYIDELEENGILSEQWSKSQQENRILKNIIKKLYKELNTSEMTEDEWLEYAIEYGKKCENED